MGSSSGVRTYSKKRDAKKYAKKYRKTFPGSDITIKKAKTGKFKGKYRVYTYSSF